MRWNVESRIQGHRDIAQRCGHRVVADPRLRERNFGVGEGLTYGELDVQWPDVFSRRSIG